MIFELCYIKIVFNILLKYYFLIMIVLFEEECMCLNLILIFYSFFS